MVLGCRPIPRKSLNRSNLRTALYRGSDKKQGYQITNHSCYARQNLNLRRQRLHPLRVGGDYPWLHRYDVQRGHIKILILVQVCNPLTTAERFERQSQRSPKKCACGSEGLRWYYMLASLVAAPITVRRAHQIALLAWGCLQEAVFACLCAKMQHTNPTTTLNAEFLPALCVFGDTPNPQNNTLQPQGEPCCQCVSTFGKLLPLGLRGKRASYLLSSLSQRPITPAPAETAENPATCSHALGGPLQGRQ